MLTCTRQLSFCAGHRVVGHEGHCRRLHGHNYRVFVTACAKGLRVGHDADQLDDVGRVVDFSILKAKVGGWIEAHWDHSFIVQDLDIEALTALRTIKGQTIFELPYNPTAENLARFLLRKVGPLVLKDTDVELVRVVVEETDNCSAEAR